MLFNSVDFAVFLILVFILYWILGSKRIKHQNILLLFASYFFYACWDWRFLFLLLFSTFLDYFSALRMQQTISVTSKKIWFWVSILINLGFLGVFKYYNFFIDSFGGFLRALGWQVNVNTLNIILPVGISFYTFHGLSYIIDVYKRKIKAEHNLIDYSLFVSFFPLLVAGPIERATHLLPQIKKRRYFDYANAIDGLKQILWGLFKKVVIADGCAQYVNLIFENSSNHSGSTLLLGGILFAFQIYGDFSGYSDVAIGTAKLFGINLLKNFSFPYFSRGIAEFWRRWHISLSSWFKDYLYIPLGGSHGGLLKKMRNVTIIFLVSGLWHGANWTFIAWGLLNAIFILPSVVFKLNRSHLDVVAKGKVLPNLKDVFQIVFTFFLTVVAWIFFRASDLHHAFQYLAGIFNSSLWGIPEILPLKLLMLIALFMIIEWLGREGNHGLEMFASKWYRPIRVLFYYLLVFSVFWFSGEQYQFIYFQF